MNREQIIRMAREAGFTSGEIAWHDEMFERFAALVAAAERNKLAAWMIQRGYATGHGDTTENLLKELDWQVLANWSSAMKTGAENEREACARIAWNHEPDDNGPIEATIRARGQA